MTIGVNPIANCEVTISLLLILDPAVSGVD